MEETHFCSNPLLTSAHLLNHPLKVKYFHPYVLLHFFFSASFGKIIENMSRKNVSIHKEKSNKQSKPKPNKQTLLPLLCNSSVHSW